MFELPHVGQHGEALKRLKLGKTQQIWVPYSAFPVFQPFHVDKAREVWLFGAFASGKTIALAGDAIELGVKQYGSRIMMSRLTIASLRDTLESEFINLLTKNEGDQDATTLWQLCEARKANNHYETVVFPNGSVYKFLGLDDWQKRMGFSVSGFYVDEASQVPLETYIQISQSRVRQQQITPEARQLGFLERPPDQWERRIRAAQNPAGHDWAWDRFVNITDAERDRLAKQGIGRSYHRSTAMDNPTLYKEDGTPNEFLTGMLNMPEQWVKRYVLCQFDEFAGSILDFARQSHVVPSFQVPAHWKRAMGFDWGLRAPAAAGWWAQDPDDGTWYKYREWMAHDPGPDVQRADPERVMPPTEVARMLLALEANDPAISLRAADPDVRKRHPAGEDVRTTEHWFTQMGMHFQLGAKDHTTRIAAQIEMLHTGRAKIMECCPISIRQYENYRWETAVPGQVGREKDVKDRPRKVDDHLVDADQYLFSLWYTGNKPKRYVDETPKTVEEAHNEMVHARIQEKIQKAMAKKNKQGNRGRFGPRMK